MNIYILQEEPLFVKLNFLSQFRWAPIFLNKKIRPPRIKNGAGEGNRTLVTSLEGWRSTIELHPHKWSEQQDSNLRPLGPEPSALPNCAMPRQRNWLYQQSPILSMDFLEKISLCFLFSLWYNNSSETAVYIFLGEETAPSIFVVFDESLPAAWAGFFHVLIT